VHHFVAVIHKIASADRSGYDGRREPRRQVGNGQVDNVDIWPMGRIRDLSERTQRLADDLAQHLRTRVLNGELQPESTISESAIATEYGVARPTARTALELLVTDGLMSRKSHLPARVASIGLTDMAEVVALLEFAEDRSLNQIVDGRYDLRVLQAALDDTTPRLLDEMVGLVGSPRLRALHRRSTFEFLLGLEQHGIATATESGDIRRAKHWTLVEALFAQRHDDARHALDALQQTRAGLLVLARVAASSD